MDMSLQRHNSMPFLFLFLLLAISISVAAISIAATPPFTTHPLDLEALSQIKSSILPSSIPPGSCLSSWDFSVDPCLSRFRQFFTCGIDCSLVADDHHLPSSSSSSSSPPLKYLRVFRLVFDDAGYSGLLSPFLGNLTSLRFLQLSANSLSGPIPPTISKLSSLSLLDLSSNRFDGELPYSVGTLINLATLDVSGNLLRGPIPSSLNRLSSLTQLRLQNNLFDGSLPDLRSVGLLRQLDVSCNALSGAFPSQLPTFLSSISLRSNHFSGNLPNRIISSFPQLTVLDLSDNQFSGTVGDAVLAHQSLQQLNLSSNKLSQIRAHAKHIKHSSLVALDLSYNLIAGPLPSFFALMKQLSSLSLRYNFFHGSIPQSYGAKAMANGVQAKPLQRLLLDGNYLTGPLPAPLIDGIVRDRPIAVSVGDNCFQDCPAQYAFCQGKNQKTETLCRLFNTSP